MSMGIVGRGQLLLVRTMAHPYGLSTIGLSTSADIRARSRLAVKRRFGYDARSHVWCEIEMYFRRFQRYSFRHAPSKRSISQARAAPPRVLFAARRRMPTYRRQHHCPLLARATLPKTTAEFSPELTCKVEHRMISGWLLAHATRIL